MGNLLPLLERIDWMGDVARLTARTRAPWAAPALAVGVMIVALGLGSQGPAGRVVAAIGACVGAFAASVLLIGLRARFVVSFDFAARLVRVEDTRGFARPTRSERAFEDIGEVLTKRTADGALRLGIMWRGDDAPTIVAQLRSPITAELERRLREAGL